ncbi:helicase C-terminal domain-containing protein [Paratractidigestivibacter sp.]|uniref:helicase C-terminal domain-containing protein n=1 Tax=Paratractidigestivibacter sp. TaxID=2847316 RepID=UPI002AC8D866|nr:helicase C-terminal domain-containing protein [Paratractidigestivibacter sp.]
MSQDMQHEAAAASLEELIMPGTPASVKAAYRSLAERAKTARFGLLEDDLVVLDTETTGLSFRDCELIEVSAARIQGRKIVERFETYVDPGRPIPPEIQKLTGISQIDVAGAPSPREAVAMLADFVGGVPVLAHNATFDRTFVEAVPGGANVSDTWVDTLALSRIALPRLTSHRLADMASAFGCAAVTHNASDDVDALCGMWRIILCALSDLPCGLMGFLADMHPEIDWAFRPVLSQLALADEGVRFSLPAVRARLVEAECGHVRMDAQELDGSPMCPTPEEVTAELREGGVASRMYERLERRPEQEEMAREVTRALKESTHRAIEAGTGVGKSLAYLLPMALYAQRNNVTVGVATKTNALTDQLVSHELPALSAALPEGLEFHSLKGYDHYPCLHRMDRAVREDLPIAAGKKDGRSDNAVGADMLTALAVCYSFACQSPDGDLDALGIRWRYVPRSMLTTTSGECLKSRCPYYPHLCLLHGARKRAACGDVVVTNHSLLLRNVDADGNILPPIRHWVVDEAHAFESEARRQWAVEVSGEEARVAFELLGGMKTGVIRNLVAQAAKLDNSTLVTGLLAKASATIARATMATADLFDVTHGLVGMARGGEGGYDLVTLWIDDAVRATDEWAAVVEAGEHAADVLAAAAKELKEAADALRETDAHAASDLGESTRFLTELLAGVRLICVEPDPAYVYSAQLSRSRKRMNMEKLCAEKLDIGADLAERWLPEMESVVFTSATIAVGESFEHFDAAIGLDRVGGNMHRDLRLDSSFDFDRNMSIVVAKDMPAPNERGYIDALVDLLYDVHVSMGGSVLTLFTNRRDMERVHEALAPRLAEAGLELAQQGRGASARRLRDQFVADKSLSLLALKSFWEGFDAAGDTLRCVVIPKLPFASPNDPLVKEREARDQRAWWKYSLPEAVISVKQAAGRLIRTSTDTGVLVLADSRLVTKRYGRQFIASLPSKSVQQMNRAGIGRFIKMWRASRK